jgi:molybdopterin-guanine dinucleotide biosynthesis protein A
MDAVVLAGGASRRMGRDKALLRIDGRRLVDHVVDRLIPLEGEVVVASGTSRRVGGHVEVTDVPDVPGPLGGLLAGLDATSSEYVAVVAVDQPAPSAEVLLLLADACRRHRRPAAMPVVLGVAQPFHAVVARNALPALRAIVRAGERSPRRALARLDALLVGPDGWQPVVPDGSFARDWDRPEDLPRGV